MPELPEVETLKRELAHVLPGKKIAAFESAKFAHLNLVGKKISKVERRAKILIFKLQAPPSKLPAFLLIHLKLTGQLIFKNKNQLIIGGHPADPTKHTRAIFTFSDGSQLFFNDLRKFGWLKVVGGADLAKIFSATGVEPLSPAFTLPVLRKILARHPKRNLKQFLLDQTLVAGLGNIYVDESCFAASVLPMRIVKSLTANEIEKLHRAIISVLKLATKHKGTSARNYVRADGSPGGFVPYLNVYGRGRQKCKVCQTPIVKIKLAGRGTHYCPHCQK